MINYPKKIDLNKFQENTNNPENKFGLPKEIKFCKKCVVSNQRPNSTIEFANKPTEKENYSFFDDKGICDACNYSEKKKILIGKKENLNFKNYAINIEKLMVNMIVLFLAQVEKTVFLHLIY